MHPLPLPLKMAQVEIPPPPQFLGGTILTTLRNRVLNWHYPPDHHLGEVALCDEFPTSRVPVREALRALTEQGLVQKVPNQGCFVIQPDVGEIHDLYDMRLALELFVVESLASGRFLPRDWIGPQREIWTPWLHIRADETVDRSTLVDADTAFHLGLAEWEFAHFGRFEGNQRAA